MQAERDQAIAVLVSRSRRQRRNRAVSGPGQPRKAPRHVGRSRNAPAGGLAGTAQGGVAGSETKPNEGQQEKVTHRLALRLFPTSVDKWPAVAISPAEPLGQLGGFKLFHQIPQRKHLIQPIGKGAVREAGGQAVPPRLVDGPCDFLRHTSAG
jgi:hypothetical protein